MKIKSILSPTASIGTALAVGGSVFAVYNLSIGPIAGAHASEPNHPALESSRKKAGYTSFVLVSALALITKDGNVAVIGYGSIVAMEIAYRHGIMVDANTGSIVPPSPAAYTPAENVYPLTVQGEQVSGF